MMEWLSLNMGTILVAFIILTIVTGIIYHLHNEKKQGKTCCGKSCGDCALNGKCH